MNSRRQNTNTKNGWLSILMLAFLPWLTGCANSNWPFEVQKAGSKVEIEYRAAEHRFYTFNLGLMYQKGNEADWARVKKLAGGYKKDLFDKLIEPGVPISLHLKIDLIDNAGERTISEQDVSELRMTSSGSGSFVKKIAGVPLKPGRYRISVESLKDVPELIGTPVVFSIGFPAKTRPID